MKYSDTTTRNLKAAVAGTLPAGHRFRIIAEPTYVGKTHVLRVITDAWQRKPRFDRVQRMHKVILPVLNEKEKDRVFRISVLTPDEWRDIRADQIFGPREFTVLATAAARPAKALSARKPARAASAKSSPSRRTTKPATS